MAMTAVWTGLVAASICYALATGNVNSLSKSVYQGGQAAVDLCLSMAGTLCLWCGVLEVMRRCGLLRGLEGLLRPVLGRLFPDARRDEETMGCIAGNVSANLLGLGNAATPLGIQAVRRMAAEQGDAASDEMILFIVCNTASIQLIPTTVAAVRGGAGCTAPLDILPAIWVSSCISVTAGICAAKLLRRVWSRL